MINITELYRPRRQKGSPQPQRLGRPAGAPYARTQSVTPQKSTIKFNNEVFMAK